MSKIFKKKRVVSSLMPLLKTGLWEQLWRAHSTHILIYTYTHRYVYIKICLYMHKHVSVCVCVKKHYILFWHLFSCTGKDLEYLWKEQFAAMERTGVSHKL